MSPLRSGINLLKLLTNQTKPSPTNQKEFPNFAQDSVLPGNGYLLRRSVKCRFGKGTSLFISLLRRVRAGMTVEAAIVLPLFMLFMLSMGSALEMIRLHGNIQMELWDFGRKMSLYLYGADDAGWLEAAASEDADVKAMEAVFSSVGINAWLINELGKEYLDSSPIFGGYKGLVLLESDVINGEDALDLRVTYEVRPLGGLLGNVRFRMANRYYAHMWNGYEIPGTGEVVYLAENGSVYHVNAECTHLQLSIRSVENGELGWAKNEYGQGYNACEKCVVNSQKAEPEYCFVAAKGDCYHWEEDCSGLTRTVHYVTVREAEGYRPCSRCSAERIIGE